MTKPARLLLTCEHGGHEVPPEFSRLFRGARRTLLGHRGWDPGSLELARLLAKRLDVPLFALTVSRLLVEVNRSPGHPRLFSEFTRGLAPERRRRLLEEHYWPHRRRVERWIKASLEAGCPRVVHVGVHSFTPVLDGEPRRADVGLLYDPARPAESRFCDAWRSALRRARPELVVRRNYPYLGRSDGFTTALRRRFPRSRYLGIELEVNQRWPRGDVASWQELQASLARSLAEGSEGWGVRNGE